jgi:molecular chaperone GrpE
MSRLKAELEEAKAQAERNLDLAKRIQADFDNYRKRAQREKEEQIKAANDKLLYELLGFLDDFERALTAKAARRSSDRAWIDPRQLTIIAPVQGTGGDACDRFDPALHEALCVGEGEEGKVLEVYQKGYCLGPRVVRYAKVKLAVATTEVSQMAKIIGIDLGTSNSAAAVMEGGRPTIIPSAEGQAFGGKAFPSMWPSPRTTSFWSVSRPVARR